MYVFVHLFLFFLPFFFFFLSSFLYSSLSLSLFFFVIRFTTECDGEAHLVAVSLLPELAEKGAQVIFAFVFHLC